MLVIGGEGGGLSLCTNPHIGPPRFITSICLSPILFILQPTCRPIPHRPPSLQHGSSSEPPPPIHPLVHGSQSHCTKDKRPQICVLSDLSPIQHCRRCLYWGSTPIYLCVCVCVASSANTIAARLPTSDNIRYADTTGARGGWAGLRRSFWRRIRVRRKLHSLDGIVWGWIVSRSLCSSVETLVHQLPHQALHPAPVVPFCASIQSCTKWPS